MLSVVILARSGSKRLPGKNYSIELYPGKTLLALAIEKGVQFGEVIVSSDVKKVTQLAEKEGAHTIISPHHADTSTSVDAVLYACEHFALTGDLLLLQVTSPLVDVGEIRHGLSVFAEQKRPVFAAKETYEPFWAWTSEAPLFPDCQGVRSQNLPRCYVPCGAFFFTTVNWLFEYRSFFAPGAVPVAVPRELAIDIDTIEDLELAKWQAQRLRHRKFRQPKLYAIS